MGEHICPTCGNTFKHLAERVVLLESRDGVVIDSKYIPLTASQFDVFDSLWQAHPRTITSDHMASNMYGVDEPEDADGTIKVFICKLRKALEGTSALVLNVWGKGYRLQIANLEKMEKAA